MYELSKRISQPELAKQVARIEEACFLFKCLARNYRTICLGMRAELNNEQLENVLVTADKLLKESGVEFNCVWLAAGNFVTPPVTEKEAPPIPTSESPEEETSSEPQCCCNKWKTESQLRREYLEGLQGYPPKKIWPWIKEAETLYLQRTGRMRIFNVLDLAANPDKTPKEFVEELLEKDSLKDAT